MAISFRRYVDITSGVGTGERVPGRQFIGRLFTTNPLAPSGNVITFTEAGEVSAFFGPDSQEYKRAAFYFGWISKMQTRARAISFERWIPEAIPATLRSATAVHDLEEFAYIDNGSLALRINGETQNILELDFSEAMSYADVASIVQNGVRKVSTDPVYANALVTFDAQTRALTLTVGQAGATEIAPATNPDTGDPIAEMLGWTAASGAITSDGVDAVSITKTLNKSADLDNNFGTFLFMGELTKAQMAEAAAFADSSNAGFRYCQRVTVDEAAAAHEALKNYEGVCLDEYDPFNADEYPEMMSMIILAATDFTRLNGTQGYMFQQFAGVTPTVTDNTKANTLDALRVNYYGRTQQSGQLLDFYQRGVLQGGNIIDINVYDNEMWLKDRAGADIMTLLLALPRIGANDTGRAQVLGALRNVVDMGLNNGAISINKPLSYAQKTFITTVTGEDTAWVQVQSQGYWLDAQIQEYTVDGRQEYKVVYLLVYSKDDLIRKVEGTHSLI